MSANVNQLRGDALSFVAYLVNRNIARRACGYIFVFAKRIKCDLIDRPIRFDDLNGIVDFKGPSTLE